MGKAIFQTEIIELGEQVDAFFEEGMFVLFGDNVPDTLKDFCLHRSEEGRRNNQKRR